MFELTDEKMVYLDKRLAKRFANMKPFAGERVLRKRRLDYLHRRYQEGNFHTPCWASCKVNGTEYRVNGHHSSKMLLQLTKDFPVGMNAFIMTFKAESLSDLPELFAQFDSKYSGRSASDIAGAHAGIHSELKQMGGSEVARICYAIALSDTDCWKLCRNGRPDEEERARLIHDDRNPEFALWARMIVDHPATNLSGVISAAYRTWLKDSHYANVFWGHVIKESHPDPVHPSRLLARLLLGRHKDKGTVNWAPRRFMVHCLKAWNAARNKETIRTLGNYTKTTRIPMVH